VRLTQLALTCLLLCGCQLLAEHSPEQHSDYGTIVYDNFAPGLGVHAPMFSALRAPMGPQQYRTLRLVLDVDRRVPVGADVSVELKLPHGVQLTSGRTSTRLRRNLQAQRDQLAFDLHVGATPAVDLLVIVDARGPHFGYHATHPYRFGRPAPTPEALETRGRELTVAGKSFGRSVVVR
jgi:hypothetical protein